ncbi:hypothetical protein BH10PSE6_BH10PSE6_31170 [soil metagenome]
MPLMGWDAFCDAHHRPFMIHAQVDEEGSRRFEALQRFIESLNLRGNFALCEGDNSLRAAFESEKEAVKTARLLGAKKVGRGAEWAGEWAFVLNEAAMAKITSAVRTPRRRPDDRAFQRVP